MKFFFVLIICVSFVYHLFKKRKVDLFTIAFFSAFLYFLPGLFGYVIEPQLINGIREMVKVPLVENAYIVMSLVLISITLTTYLNDYITKSKKKKNIQNKSILESKYILQSYVFISIISFIYVLYSTEFSLFTGKTNVWEDLGIIKILLTLSTNFAFITSYIKKQKFPLIYSIIMIAVLFLMGNRSVLAIAFLSAFLYKLNNYGKVKLIQLIRPKLLMITGIMGVILFNGKSIYGAFQREGLATAIKVLFNTDLLLEKVVTSEPFGTQNILNTVLSDNYTIDIETLKTLPTHLLIAPGHFGRDTQSFSKDFTETFYPYVDYGLAYNIWAESYALGGWLFLILIIIIFSLFLLIFNSLIEWKDMYLKSLFISMSVYLAFYIHRNSIDTILTFERHLIYIYILGLIISFMLTTVLSKRKINQQAFLFMR